MHHCIHTQKPFLSTNGTEFLQSNKPKPMSSSDSSFSSSFSGFFSSSAGVSAAAAPPAPPVGAAAAPPPDPTFKSISLTFLPSRACKHDSIYSSTPPQSAQHELLTFAKRVVHIDSTSSTFAALMSVWSLSGFLEISKFIRTSEGYRLRSRQHRRRRG